LSGVGEKSGDEEKFEKRNNIKRYQDVESGVEIK
jgi:hypothetical protein